MRRTMQVSGSIVIRAEADAIWAQVADPTQMPRWSLENTGASTRADVCPRCQWARYSKAPTGGAARGG